LRCDLQQHYIGTSRDFKYVITLLSNRWSFGVVKNFLARSCMLEVLAVLYFLTYDVLGLAL